MRFGKCDKEPIKTHRTRSEASLPFKIHKHLSILLWSKASFLVLLYAQWSLLILCTALLHCSLV